MTRADLQKKLLPLAALLLFAVSVFMVINQREHIRLQEERKQEARKRSIVLRDEWRNLQLEYETLTGYNELHQQAGRLGLVSPNVGDETFLYLAEDRP